MSRLVLLRHGESVWNAQGLWTGKTDVPLSEQGMEQVRRMADLVADVDVHLCHTSTLGRAQQTAEEIKRLRGWESLPTFAHPALDERDYGELTGKNKWQVKEQFGDEAFHQLRRGWNHPVPAGETLMDVHARVVAYWQEKILPALKSEQNVLLAFHGNSMRALIKQLESISDQDIAHLEIGFGEVYLYDLNEEGVIKKKEIRRIP